MMSLAAIVLIASVIIFALIGVPLVWSLVLASVCSVAAGGTLNALPILAQRMFAGGLQYSMLAIFFFVLAGNYAVWWSFAQTGCFCKQSCWAY